MGGICIPKAENIHKHEHDKKHVTKQQENNDLSLVFIVNKFTPKYPKIFTPKYFKILILNKLTLRFT